MSIKEGISGTLPRPMTIESPGDSPPSHQENAGTVTTRAEVEAWASALERADISTMRKILAIALTTFALLCIGAYFVYLMIMRDTQALGGFITVVVGILGLVTGYYFGPGKDASK